MKATWPVRITPADNGIIVRVGCKLMVFNKADHPKFLSALKRYLAGDEDELRKEFFPEDCDQPAPPLETGCGDEGEF